MNKHYSYYFYKKYLLNRSINLGIVLLTLSSVANAKVAQPVIDTLATPVTTNHTANLVISDYEAKIAKVSKQLEMMKLEKQKLSLENELQTEQHRQNLLAMEQEKERLELEYALLLEKARHELVTLTTEKDKLLLENEITSAQHTKMLADLETKKTRLELEATVREQESAKALAHLAAEKSQLAAKNALVEEKNRQEELKIHIETARLGFEITKMEFEKSKRHADLEALNEKIAERNTREEWDSQVNKPKEYLEEPYQNGHLVISDRRIELNDPIFFGTADYIVERLHYFNNKDTQYPIFLVIDSCPGGSVMEGAKIIKAMQNSRAPVYVVVKSLAASMAAIITSLAERSYAYPEAIIVHHQMWNGMLGNIRQHEENLEFMKEWSKRLLTPVAKNMGLTLEEFVEQMYKHNSEGNWREFATGATQYDWVDYVVEDIRDVSFDKKPEDQQEGSSGLILFERLQQEKIDDKGQRYVQLPRLRPTDFYHIYNPDKYYRY